MKSPTHRKTQNDARKIVEPNDMYIYKYLCLNSVMWWDWSYGNF